MKNQGVLAAVLRPLRTILRHSMHSFELLITAGGMPMLIKVMLTVVIFWHIYTPIHELLHVAACFLTGGTVSELALSPQYGAVFLQKIFPFIVSGSDYAGQLTGFQVPNYWAYALVDMLPFALSVPGLALVELARRRRSAVFFGVGLVLAYVPIMSVPGDFYEAASLVTTQLANPGNTGLPADFLLSDDFFKLCGSLAEAGALRPAVIFWLAAGLLAGMGGALCLLLFQWFVARWVLRWDGSFTASPVAPAAPVAQPAANEHPTS